MGNEQVIRKLQVFPIILQKELLHAVAECAKLCVAYAKAHHPYKDRTASGGLTENIKAMRPHVEGKKIVCEIVAEKPYGRYVERGTRPHIIRPKRARILCWQDEKTGKLRFAMKVKHPGSKAYPYLAPAVEKNMPAIQRKLDQAFAKAKKKAGLH